MKRLIKKQEEVKASTKDYSKLDPGHMENGEIWYGPFHTPEAMLEDLWTRIELEDELGVE